MPRSLQDKKAHADGKVSLWGVHLMAPARKAASYSQGATAGVWELLRSQGLFQLFLHLPQEEAPGTTRCSHWLPTAGRKGPAGCPGQQRRDDRRAGCSIKMPLRKTPSFSLTGPRLCSSSGKTQLITRLLECRTLSRGAVPRGHQTSRGDRALTFRSSRPLPALRRPDSAICLPNPLGRLCVSGRR